jgi:hypothetical protein
MLVLEKLGKWMKIEEFSRPQAKTASAVLFIAPVITSRARETSPRIVACPERECRAVAGTSCVTKNGMPRREPHDGRSFRARDLTRLLRDER